MGARSVLLILATAGLFAGIALPLLSAPDAPPPAPIDGAAGDPGGDDASRGPASGADATLLPPLTGGFVAGSYGLSEPTIDISPDGRIFVTAIPGISIPFGAVTRSPIYELVDGEWVIRGWGVERYGEIGGGDADLEFDSRGRGYHTDLWLGNDGMSVSADGASWIGSPVSHYLAGTDRQWFAHWGDAYLYKITNHLGAGIVSIRASLNTAAGEKGAFASVVETPVGCICGGPPGFPSVHQPTGRLYVPVPFGDDELRMYRSVNHGLTFDYAVVPGSADVRNIFAVSAVDAAGTVYVVWSQENGGQFDVFMSRSMDRGGHYTKPIKLSEGSGTHLFPWIVAGAAGKIAVVWYETDVRGNNNDVSAFANAEWHVRYVESMNADTSTATFQSWDLTGTMHVGTISTQGFTAESFQGEGPDRSLGDFFSAAVSPVDGRVWVVYNKNDPATPEHERGVWVSEMPAGASPLL